MTGIQDVEMYAPSMNDARVVGGRYQLEEVIGRGGMKDVYRGRDLQTEEGVAVARMIGIDRRIIESEVELAKKVDSPHVARVRDAFVDGDVAYIVSELCQGPTLAERVEQRPFSVDEALPIFLAMAAGMEAIHQACILHRDVKLNNIILRERPGEVSVAILDFGISAPAADERTSAGALPASGTLGYMAREAILGEALDARADVYALGICFFEMLTGRAPLTMDEGVFPFLERIRTLDAHDLSPLPAMPAPLRQLLERMLSMRAEGRPYMPVVRAALAELVGGESAPRARPTPPPAARTPPRALPLLPVATIPHRGGHPDAVVVSGWTWAPLVLLSPLQGSTRVEAWTVEGLRRWSIEVAGDYRRGLTADLDGDGVRELYLLGPGGLACLDARGALLHRQEHDASADSTAFVIDDALTPCLVVDGQRFLRGGRSLGPAPRTYEGDGKALVVARDGRGLAYNGYAGQAFRGAFRTGAAILHHREAGASFWVAHLEASARPGTLEAKLRVYGPGGKRVQDLAIATASSDTGDARVARRWHSSEDRVFDDRNAPIALERERDFVVAVPFVGGVGPFAPCVVAFSAPEGRELWRATLPASQPGSAIFADIGGQGRASLLVGAPGMPVRAHEPVSGELQGEGAAVGAPIAYGDPFGTGFAHLITQQEDALALWRGPATLPGRVEWAGARADRWRSGLRGLRGTPLGPA